MPLFVAALWTGEAGCMHSTAASVKQVVDHELSLRCNAHEHCADTTRTTPIHLLLAHVLQADSLKLLHRDISGVVHVSKGCRLIRWTPPEQAQQL